MSLTVWLGVRDKFTCFVLSFIEAIVFFTVLSALYFVIVAGIYVWLASTWGGLKLESFWDIGGWPKALPAWIDAPAYEDAGRLRGQIEQAIQRYAAAYAAYLERHASRMPTGVEPFDPLPRVLLLPGLGALCAGGDARAAGIARVEHRKAQN